MEDMIEGLVEKCGLSKDQAKKVYSFLKDNASKVPEWLGDMDLDDIKDKLPGGLKNLF